MINILFLGDVFGRPGRHFLREKLGSLISEYQLDLVIANAENASGGVGLSAESASELLDYGVDVLSGGNHTFRFKDLFEENYRLENHVIRPANFPSPCPGIGYTIVESRAGHRVAVLNLLGRVFINQGLDCPFKTADKIVAKIKEKNIRSIILDFHAEGTSEKRALGWYLDGRVSAVLGTHTHVPTNDAHILPLGTAFQTDVGMCGPHNSVIGMRTEEVLNRFLTGRPQKFEAAKKGVQLNATLLVIDSKTGLAESIKPLIIHKIL